MEMEMRYKAGFKSDETRVRVSLKKFRMELEEEIDDGVDSSINSTNKKRGLGFNGRVMLVVVNMDFQEQMLFEAGITGGDSYAELVWMEIILSCRNGVGEELDAGVGLRCNCNWWLLQGENARFNGFDLFVLLLVENDTERWKERAMKLSAVVIVQLLARVQSSKACKEWERWGEEYNGLNLVQAS
ncbi:hypothetical protein C5167_036866 [Papaver somniferum]|uniref:Uncharacterized protein n=1 Tax=Papaver somniferum TaxID=3469 RepID=A0A4Y7I4T1_PAPSO|nr:hypothetical protein C5167_036866 [Papaver somniferum]